MTDRLAAAAETMGVPEALVERSARAQAVATGTEYEEVLAAWAGGEAVEAPAPPAEPTAAEESTEEAAEPADAPPAEAPAEVEVEPSPPEAPVAEPAAAAASLAQPPPPPLLEAPPDRPLVGVLGGVAVVVVGMVLGLILPSIPAESGEVRTSNLDLTEAAIRGRSVYRQAGCASCHTQVVRPVVADVGLGAVTLHDTDQVIGYRRIGPDLSNVGSRLGPAALQALVTGPSHPPLALSSEALADLVAYLSQSSTAEAETSDTTGTTEAPAGEENDATTEGESTP